MYLYLHSPNTISWRDAQLKHRDNFTLAYFHWHTTIIHLISLRAKKKKWEINLQKLSLSETR